MIAKDTCAPDNDKKLDRLWGECKTAISGETAAEHPSAHFLCTFLAFRHVYHLHSS